MIRPALSVVRCLIPGSQIITRFTNFYRLDDNLTRSAQLTAKQLEQVVREYGVKSFVSLRPPRLDKKWYHKDVRVCQEAGIDSVHLGIDGRRMPSRAELLSMIKVIQDYRKPMHVQCRSGADRTGLFAGVYEIVVNKKTVIEARKQCSMYFGNIMPRQRRFFDALKGADVNGDLKKWVMDNYDP
jgi:protein tyrosine phosphatase (PTP) superfamily phosphohydrolase (DUF442 family)